MHVGGNWKVVQFPLLVDICSVSQIASGILILLALISISFATKFGHLPGDSLIFEKVQKMQTKSSVMMLHVQFVIKFFLKGNLSS